MATAIQRTKAIADALINADASVALIERLVNGVLALSQAQIAALTQAQRAQLFLGLMRNQVKSRVAEHEGGTDVNEARAAAIAAVDTDFTEAP